MTSGCRCILLQNKNISTCFRSIRFYFIIQTDDNDKLQAKWCISFKAMICSSIENNALVWVHSRMIQSDMIRIALIIDFFMFFIRSISVLKWNLAKMLKICKASACAPRNQILCWFFSKRSLCFILRSLCFIIGKLKELHHFYKCSVRFIKY